MFLALRHANWPKCIFVIFVTLLMIFYVKPLSSTATANEMPVTGIVVNEDGEPLANVTVYGSRSACCSYEIEETTTNVEGAFRLERPGAVIHFSKAKFRPGALVVASATPNMQITLRADVGSAELPVCSKLGPGEKIVGWGKDSLHFAIDTRSAEIRGGKPEVDYVRYVIKPKGRKAYLALWFGGNAASLDPADELFIRSTRFELRNVIDEHRNVVGRDSWGEQANGERWRHIAVEFAGAAIYQDTALRDADLFDRIIRTMCQAQDSPAARPSK